MDVEVIRSAKRRKTVSARQVGTVLRVSIPASMSRADEARWVGEMVGRFERTARTAAFDLEARARTLARRFDLPLASSVRWVDNQHARWGSCTPVDGTIRLSSRMAGFPSWVIDSVVVHELAHLREPGHGPRFRALVERNPLSERAIGYLMATSTGATSGAPHDAPADDPDGAGCDGPAAPW